MAHVPGLRSCYATVGRLVYFGRMLDKIRLHAAGRLPTDYLNNLGTARPALFDARCCQFLGVDYAELRARTLAGGTDAELLAWAHLRGGDRTDEACGQWNRFMMKLGWRDDRSAVLQERIAEFGLTGQPIETFFDLNDYDEGRDPVAARAWLLRPARVIVLMGVAGSGKTTIGQALARRIGARFDDADAFHSPANIAKMAAGTPLDDADRAPWLLALRGHIDRCLASPEVAVLTCSALKHRYRTTLLPASNAVSLVYLRGSREQLLARIHARHDHFMKPAMLDSQLAALEEPADAVIVDIAPPPDEIVQQLVTRLAL